MKSICIVSEEYPPDTSYGGIAAYYGDLAHYLSSRGIKVYVITRDPLNVGYVKQNPNITVIRVTYPFVKLDKLNKLIGYRFVVFKELLKLCKLHSIDIIESPEWKADLLFVYLLGMSKKLPPIVIRLHGCRKLIRTYDLQKTTFSDRVVISMERFLLGKACNITSVSKSCLDDTSQLLKLNLQNKTCVLSNFADFEAAQQHMSTIVKRGRRTVCFVGRLDSLKGSYVLSKVMDRILTKYPDVRLMIAGRDVFDSSLRLMGSDVVMNNINIQNRDRVTLCGQLDRTELFQLYSTSTVTVLPSSYETFGLCCVESMMCSTPVIASANGGMKYIVEDGVTGLLINPNSEDDIYNAICFYMDNLRLAEQHGLLARKRAEKLFSADVVVNAIEEYYNKIIRKESAGENNFE